MCNYIVYRFGLCRCWAAKPMLRDVCSEMRGVISTDLPYEFGADRKPERCANIAVEEIIIPHGCCSWHKGPDPSSYADLEKVDELVWQVPLYPGPPENLFREINWGPRTLPEPKLSLQAEKGMFDIRGSPSGKCIVSNSLTESRQRRRQQRNGRKRKERPLPPSEHLQELRPAKRPMLRLSGSRRMSLLRRCIEQELSGTIRANAAKPGSATVSFKQAIWARAPELEPYNAATAHLKPAHLFSRSSKTADRTSQKQLSADHRGEVTAVTDMLTRLRTESNTLSDSGSVITVIHRSPLLNPSQPGSVDEEEDIFFDAVESLDIGSDILAR